MKKFIFYWINGKSEVAEGVNGFNALHRAGYGIEAMQAFDFFQESNIPTYSWNATTHNWDPIKCRECEKKGKYSLVKASKTTLNSLVSYADFGGDAGQRGTTQSRTGPAKFVDCLSCPSCGHSFIL